MTHPTDALVASVLWTWWSWNIPGDLATMLSLSFIVYAFEGGTIIAIVSGIVSYLVVIRRSSFASHALGHVGFSGAAGAVLYAINPFYGLLSFTMASATGMSLLGKRAANRDVEIGTVLAFMLGLGLLFLSLYKGYASEAYSILFGDIIAISAQQVELTAITGLAVLAVLAFFFRPILFASLDEEVAEAKRMPTLFLGWLFLVCLAAAISVAVTVIGVLLIFALTVTPAAIAVRLAQRPRNAILISVGVALFATWAGIFIAFYEIEPTSFFIVTIIFVIYLIVRAAPLVRRALRPRASYAADPGSGTVPSVLPPRRQPAAAPESTPTVLGDGGPG
jgi:zinc/manganese transport system permease protein